MSAGHILALSGGVGGAKLAAGLAAVLPPDRLTIAVNTGDDFEHLGLTICPDIEFSNASVSSRCGPVIAVSVRLFAAVLYSSRRPKLGLIPSQSSVPRKNGTSARNPISPTDPSGCTQIWSNAVAI